MICHDCNDTGYDASGQRCWCQPIVPFPWGFLIIVMAIWTATYFAL